MSTSQAEVWINVKTISNISCEKYLIFHHWINSLLILNPETIRMKNLKGYSKTKKAAGIDKISLEVWKSNGLKDVLLHIYNATYKWEDIDRWTEFCIPTFSEKDLWSAWNYRRMSLTPIEANIYIERFLNGIQPNVEKFISKYVNHFR